MIRANIMKCGAARRFGSGVKAPSAPTGQDEY